MCNSERLNVPVATLIEMFTDAKIPLSFPRGRPNLEAKDYRITDSTPIVWIGAEGPQLDLVRWSWPGPGGKPVYNFRSEGRRFGQGRCLIPTDGFYEYTAPADPKAKRKDRWVFTMPGHPLFAIAGLVRPGAAAGQDAFAMLTVEAGRDVAPLHARQPVALRPEQWSAWLSHAPNEATLLVPSRAGLLRADRA